MTTVPTGTVTFLFTDIEGSLKLWQQHPDAMPGALARHHAILNQALAAQGGYVFQIVGDAFCAAFLTATAGLEAALAAQRALRDQAWGATGPIRVRMALHTGAAEVRVGEHVSGEYVSGLTLSRAARLLSTGHGGQILISQPSFELMRDYLPAGVMLRDLGERRLKDLIRPEHIYQVTAPDLPAEFPPLKTLDAQPNNLPAQVTSFIGREREMAEVKQLLGGTRLLTLTGSGGAGKTRLSLQVAADVVDDYSDGAWFVDLAPLTDSALVPRAAALALGLRDEAKRPMIETLAGHLRGKTLLLVLDNCEHVVQACAQLADTLLRACPLLKILASSREALRIAGETTYRVPSLGLPPLGSLTLDRQSLSQYEAVRLFVDRATAAQPRFAITSANAPAVAQICYRLDGIPLAIELAAARVKALSVEQIAARLDDRFRLLTGGSRAALPRQQTLRALIDWSHDLLAESERVVWRRLAAFSGGWTLEAAEAVCADAKIDSHEISDVLFRLVDKSLVVADERGEQIRYTMLETLRQYGHEKRQAAGEDAVIRQRHLNFFVELAEQAQAKLQTPEQKEWLARLDAEYDNVRAALAWSWQSEPVIGLRLAVAVGHYRQTRGYLAEAREAIDRALQAAPDAPKDLKAKGLNWQGTIAARQGDYEFASIPLDASIRLWRELGDRDGLASALTVMGIVTWTRGEYGAAHACYQEALTLFRELGDARAVAGSLTNLGNLAVAQGDTASARRYCEESVAILRELRDELSLGYALNNLGFVVEMQHEYAVAMRLYEECVATFERLGEKLAIGYALNGMGHVLYLMGDNPGAYRRYRASLDVFGEAGDKRGIAYCLEGFAKLAVKEGEASRATRLLAFAAAWRETLGAGLSQSELAEIETDVATARELLGEALFAAMWAEGRAMTAEQVIAYALETAR